LFNYLIFIALYTMSAAKATVAKNDFTTLFIVCSIIILYISLLVGFFIMGPFQPFIWIFCMVYGIELDRRNFSGLLCIVCSLMFLLFSMQMFVCVVIISEKYQEKTLKETQQLDAPNCQKLVNVD